MNYSQFCSSICDKLHKESGGRLRPVRDMVKKNNNVFLDALFLPSPAGGSGPLVCLEPLYAQYQKGIALDTICQALLSFWQMRPPLAPDILQEILEPEKIKDRIAFRLVSRDRNRSLLEDVPWVPFCDLAVVFYISLEAADGEFLSTLIHASLLSLWGMDTVTLFSLARAAAPALFPARLTSLDELLSPLLPSPGESSLDPPGLFVLTNEAGIYGASCMLYENAVKDFADRQGTDVIILPSSIHEVLLLPDRLEYDPYLLCQMVREINSRDVLPEDILSDNIYFYRRREQKITAFSPSSCHTPGPDGTGSP